MMTKQKDEGVSIDGDDIMLMIEGLYSVLAIMMLVMTMLVTVILITLAIMMVITLMMRMMDGSLMVANE